MYGWWRETIDIVKKMIQRPAPLWRFCYIYQVSRPCGPPSFHFLWNHGFKLLALCSQFGALTQLRFIRCPDWFRYLYRPWFWPGDWRQLSLRREFSSSWWLLGNRERLATPSDRSKGALISAHAQVIGPVEIGENAKVGAAAVVKADVLVMWQLSVFRLSAFMVEGWAGHSWSRRKRNYVNKLEQ